MTDPTQAAPLTDADLDRLDRPAREGGIPMSGHILIPSATVRALIAELRQLREEAREVAPLVGAASYARERTTDGMFFGGLDKDQCRDIYGRLHRALAAKEKP